MQQLEQQIGGWLVWLDAGLAAASIGLAGGFIGAGCCWIGIGFGCSGIATTIGYIGLAGIGHRGDGAPLDGCSRWLELLVAVLLAAPDAGLAALLAAGWFGVLLLLLVWLALAGGKFDLVD